MNLMRRLLPYAALSVMLAAMVFYGSGYVWSSPAQEFNVTAEAYFANWTQLDWVDPYAFNVSLGYLNLTTSGGAWILLNATNNSMIRTSAGDFAEIIISNNTPTANHINVSRNSFVNFTVRFNASLLRPGRYTGNMTISNNTNPAVNINNLTIRLDIPLTTNFTFSRSNNFFGNISNLNAVDFYYMNASNMSGIYVNVNDSRLDLLLFESGNLVAFNNTNSSNNRTLFYGFPAYNGIYELKVFYNITNVSQYIPYNGIVEFSSLNSSLQFLHYAVNASPDAALPTSIIFVLNNTNRINFTTVTETETISKFERYVNMQNSTNITILIPSNYVSIDATLEWNNISADFNLTVYNSSDVSVSNQSKRTDMFNVTGLGFNRIFSRSVVNINEFNKSWYVSVKGGALVYYNLTIKINLGNSWLSSSFGNNTRQYVFNSTQSNATIDFNVSVPSLSTDGIYNGTITFRADTGHYMIVPFGINVTAPTLTVNNSLSKILIYIADNVGTSKFLDYLLTVNNTGSFALTLNHTNSSWLNDSSTNSAGFNYSFESPVTTKNSTLLRIRLNVTTSTTSAGESVYYGWIKLNASNAHPYSEFLINITLNLTDKLNVIVHNIANQTDKGVWINPINKTVNYTHLASSDPVFVNVTVNVTYQNNSFVSGLNATNFTVWLQNEFPYEGSNYTHNFTDVNITRVMQAVPAENSYVVNISIPSTIAGGNYSVYATVVDKGSGTRNSGTARLDYLYVNSSALVIDVYNGTHDNDEFFNTGDRSVFVNVTNVGGGALFNVTLELSLSGSCTGVASGYTGNYNIGNLSGFRSYTNSSATWKVTIGSNATCTATIKGLGPPGVWVLNDTLIYAYKGVAISSGNTGVIGGGGSSALSLAITTDKQTYFKASPVTINFTATSGGSNIGGVTVKFNITDPKGAKVWDSSCTTTSGKCSDSYTPAAGVIGTFKVAALATKDTYTGASTTKTFDVTGYNATIPAYTKSIYMLQGNSNTTTVTVRNSGSFDGKMSLAVKDLDNSWWSVTPANATIIAGQAFDFSAKFSVPSNVVVKNYTARYSVSSDEELTIEYFYIVVLPTEATKLEINATLLNYTNSLQALAGRLNNSMFASPNNTELKLAEEKINAAVSLLSQAENYISKGDYVKANELALQAKSLIDAAETLIRTVETRQGSSRLGNVLTVAGVVAGAILVGLLVYMFLPEPGYSPSKGYTIPEQAGPAGRVKQRLKKIEDLIRELYGKIKELIEKVSGKKNEYTPR
ncbi:MAG: hypothetical protein HY051_04480 [Candidatus Aenigmarchaeota archaeon]|nr:hypothetical protein [Candidatus Aenigmarchaeota archaeon]